MVATVGAVVSACVATVEVGLPEIVTEVVGRSVAMGATVVVALEIGVVVATGSILVVLVALVTAPDATTVAAPEPVTGVPVAVIADVVWVIETAPL